MSGAANDLVEVSELHFSYGDLSIFRGLSLKIPRGKVVAILGGSGSGKSTLLKLIGGQLAPARGWIRVDGKLVHKLATDELYALRLKMGMMFQSSGLFTDLSVYENVAFPLREQTDLSEAMIRDIVLMKLNAVGLRGAAELRISEVSGGMARRVALARAIVLDPECMAISDYVVLMATGGRIVAHGPPAQLMDSADPETRQFVRGEPDGPVKFHYPAPEIGSDFGIAA